MKTAKTLLAFFCFVTALLISGRVSFGSRALASAPEECKTLANQGSEILVRVCRQRGEEFQALRILYEGSLVRNHSWRTLPPVWVWLKINGRDGTFPMEMMTGPRGGPRASFEISSTSPTQLAEFQILFGNYPDGPWDLELAFVNSAEEWDSLDGRNYRARF